MSDDEYPNFGSAWTSTSAAAPPPSDSASWNPAFRPNSDRGHARNTSTTSNDDFFDRYPGPTPEKARRQQHETLEEQDEEDASPRRRQSSISVSYAIEQRFEAASEDSAMRIPGTESDAEGPVSRRDSSTVTDLDVPRIGDIEGDDEDPIFEPNESVEEQKEHLSAHMPEPIFIGTPGMTTPLVTDDDFTKELGSIQPGTGYEHQGETLDMEEAVDEAPSAPLLDDPEEEPTLEPLQRESTMRPVNEESVLAGFDGAPAPGQPVPKAKPQLGHIDRSFTTNFTELQTPVDDTRIEEPVSQAPVSDDWPAAGDDKTFGELLGDENIPVATTQDRAAEVPHSNTAADDGWGSTADDDAFGELLGQPKAVAHETTTSVPVQEPEQIPTLNAPVTAPEDKEEDNLAAMWQAALDDDDLLEEPNDMDPSAFFDDDDPGFLEDELDIGSNAPAPPPVASTPAQPQRTASSYTPQAAQQPTPQASRGTSYTSSIGQAHGRSAGTPSTGLYDVYGHGATVQQQTPPQRPSAQTSQSFVDKAKGGYQSPYDLPMDVVKQPRQRPRQPQPTPQPAPTPPMRSSSMSSQVGQLPPGPPTVPATGLTPPNSSSGSVPPPPPPTAANGTPAAKPTPKTQSGFFEDLPVAPKLRSRPSGAYTPQAQPSPAIPPQMPPQHPSRAPVAPPTHPPQRPVAPPTPAQQPMYGGLTQPDKTPLFPEQATAPSQAQPPAPAQNQRYSPSSLPAPAQTQSRFSPAPPAPAPAAGARYSPAPAAQGAATKKYGPAPAPTTAAPPPGVQNANPFAPRTSSPLAFQHEKPQPALPNELPRGMHQMPASPPKTNSTSGTMSPERSASLSYSPIDSRPPAVSSLTSPPQRPKTQSPPNIMKMPRYSSVQSVPRPSSAAGSGAPTSQPTFLAHRRQFSREFTYATPQDERAQDPLERWKGHPIFKWGESGGILSSFPKQTPFYAAGNGIPNIKCTPGTVSVQQATNFMPMDDRNAKFPGPLTARAKGRKKDVLSWMSGKIEDLERKNESVRMDFNMDPDLKKRAEEKLVLWKIVKLFVEHDAHLEGGKQIEDEVRVILLPNLAQMSQVMELQSPASGNTDLQADAVDRSVILQLRQALLEGQRERAVWLAEEKKLWGHAMLIASTMGPETWKQIIQSFVRSQVKTVGGDARSLAALYQVFAGNADECVDELVPPSARAGFQMVSKSDRIASGNPLEGLDQWRETLGLVAGNRTPSDGQSLLALGKLLGGYGRAEAAHSCFLFARQLAKHDGADNPETNFVLLGANHESKTESFANDLDAIILTEIYEWAISLSAPSTAVHYIPHLQSYKLIHAQELAAHGLKSKAQSYCDHINTAYTSTTRPSPYYHPTFTQAVTDLNAFLSQTPQTGPAGLLSKGAMNKVSSGAASWFTKFVSGDDDQDSNGSGPGAGSEDMVSGPFGRVNGDSGQISRSGSVQDLYNPMMGGGMPYGAGAQVTTPPQQFAPSSAPSKYAPGAAGNKYAPMATGGFGATQRPASPQRPASALNYAPTAAATQPLAVPRPEAGRAASDYTPYVSDSRRGSAQFSSGSYEPRPALVEQPSAYGYQPSIPEQPAMPIEPEQDAFAKPNGFDAHEETVPDAEGGGYQPMGGYEPPSGGYEPPSYQPYQPEPEADDDEVSTKPKRRGIMDDDDDEFSKQSAASKKAEADRQADDAFKKAAEADAARDKAKAGNKKGWLGGWFGGKKDESMPTVHRAKLGEENSFYYDENLKKWVNKKGGADAATPAAATPPPPRAGPPSRAVSGMGPPSGPPSRVGSQSGIVGPPMGARPPPSTAGSAMGSPSMGPPSGPSSRSGTPAMGGPPMPAAVTALNGGDSSGPPSAPPSRPPTSMSNASDLDDLLGGPPGPGQRKAGTVKGKKKGGRYVDVMQSK
ncbi:hypothetical protein PRZ48_003361 [Zasmidium cellare]|uniref:Protein transport protein sec16 n=1 Tax=Zasmidium cellare TaxID=395010 RepID=A0ABR0EW48_ZASCE|nr:hypothetical protein PRZ48_003361 [Zasmidium cellare]